MCFVPVPFDPKPIFGKVRAPVSVTLKCYTRARRIEGAVREIGARPSKARE
jgi:hypothetical protein